MLYDMSDNAKLREIARIREKALHDEASQMKAARDEGIAQGKAEIISKLRAKGMSESEIKALLS
ncbi:MAG: hypothetical protein J5999_11780 [Oscillospiraceae bacterium]|nr:hypothetical protein [Oscillospiraceae bacterium]